MIRVSRTQESREQIKVFTQMPISASVRAEPLTAYSEIIAVEADGDFSGLHVYANLEILFKKKNTKYVSFKISTKKYDHINT